MKAETQYNDLVGTVSADVADYLKGASNDIQSIGRIFDLDEDRFTPIGISLNGVTDNSVSLVCVDKSRSTPEKEHIVKLFLDGKNAKNAKEVMFKRLHIVLYDRYDEKYPDMGFDSEESFGDHHDQSAAQ